MVILFVSYLDSNCSNGLTIAKYSRYHYKKGAGGEPAVNRYSWATWIRTAAMA